eukprot:CAMPEP_0182843512 /NCGR_PEP_ID=MMETSP0006_2-20121128/26228_1 /TAXON_ID=97485 /ORGANISM="Prymnesium parvum, Strain Texoma1" /LENGTH=44 /DNA_ID= /DNA_START= /DNA_END= /DNA_ORIENTATION=
MSSNQGGHNGEKLHASANVMRVHMKLRVSTRANHSANDVAPVEN